MNDLNQLKKDHIMRDIFSRAITDLRERDYHYAHDELVTDQFADTTFQEDEQIADLICELAFHHVSPSEPTEKELRQSYDAMMILAAKYAVSVEAYAHDSGMYNEVAA